MHILTNNNTKEKEFLILYNINSYLTYFNSKRISFL